MSEYAGRQNLPGFVSIKEAAKLLGISDKRVYEYVNEGRLPSMWAADVIMIPVEEVKKFKRRTSGRPRKTIPAWRVSAGDNTQFITSIFVQMLDGQQSSLMKKLEDIRREGKHVFPGTVVRFIVESETTPGQIEISLIWRSAVMPDEEQRQHALNELRQTFADVVDWNTARYNTGRVLMHT